MSWLDNDLNIFYIPGSGGFFLLYLILLENKHYVQFKKDTESDVVEEFFNQCPDKSHLYKLTEDQYDTFKGQSWPCFETYRDYFSSLPVALQYEISGYRLPNRKMEDIPEWKNFQVKSNIKKQFSVSNVDKWKLLEFWPDNKLTEKTQLPIDLKYKIFFHCNEIEPWLNSPGKKIVLYTDIRLQTRMCWYKHAGLFRDDLDNRNAESIRKFYRSGVAYNNKKVRSICLEAFEHANKIVYLQDLIKDPFGTLELSGNKDQIDLYNRWITINNKFNLLDKEMRKYNA